MPCNCCHSRHIMQSMGNAKKTLQWVLTSNLGTCIMMTIKLGKRRMGGLHEQRRNLSKEPERECREE